MSSQYRDISSLPPIARNLIAEMERTAMTIAQVGAALGVGERQITRWRSGREPRYGSVVALAALFDRPTEWFYTDHEPTKAAA